MVLFFFCFYYFMRNRLNAQVFIDRSASEVHLSEEILKSLMHGARHSQDLLLQSVLCCASVLLSRWWWEDLFIFPYNVFKDCK